MVVNMLNNKMINGLLKIERYNKKYEYYNKLNLSELIEILERLLENNIHMINVNRNEINNIENKNNYDKYELVRKINFSYEIMILNYVIFEKTFK